ncbi:hypothetical protein K504DRAFT_508908 [Pleomassaria siparia CBS 279.74]|uniref:DEAD/DEAH box helicase domain-containing protein n=1 Tax=Pleomassaria siparia CBS 279.74 TaxID=1314801 RepID=A0A6G1JQS2_9PLEO|nr:hypothetical protein K504DRAFT_508908 [Pleomassaria siparia CBS 279.74]
MRGPLSSSTWLTATTAIRNTSYEEAGDLIDKQGEDKTEMDHRAANDKFKHREMQAGHTAATAKAVYALQSQLVFWLRFTMPKAHLKTSEETGLSQLAKRLLQRKDESVNLRQILKVNLGLHSRFRGLQQAVMQDIVNIEPVVAYIAGTGSRKSLAFLLPACCLGFSQQVVVTPLVALQIDITN